MRNYESSWKFWKNKRHIIVLLVFFGTFNVYSLRVNLSIGIVAMTQKRYVTNSNGSQEYVDPEFDWDNKIQGSLLSSFFYGYILTQTLGGVLVRYFGGKYVYGGGIAFTSLVSILSPWLARWNVYVLFVARVISGLIEGLVVSSIYIIWAKWIPPNEQTRTTSIVTSGNYVGTVFALMFYAYLAQVAGWASLFWFSGGIGMVWFIFWCIFATNTPEENTSISKEELAYINDSFKDGKIEKTNHIAWKQLLTSKPVWALTITAFCDTWGYFTLMTLLPKYFKDMYNVNIAESGLFSALPYAALACTLPLVGFLGDQLIRLRWLSVTVIRKMFLITGNVSQTCFMIGAASWNNVVGTIFCLVMAVGLSAFNISTFMVNALDLSPEHAGIIFGFSSSIGCLPGIISPIFAGLIVSTENPTIQQWQTVFYVAAAMYVIGLLVYGLFGSGKRDSRFTEDKTKNIEQTFEST